ncbi:MAG: DUF3105 domain-containing protein [Mycobacteriales bacterium]
MASKSESDKQSPTPPQDDASASEPTTGEASARERRISRASDRPASRDGQGSRRPRGPKKTKPARGSGRKRTVTAAKAGRMATSTIVMFVVVGLVALSIIGYAIYQSYDANRPFGQQRDQQIKGLTNYRTEDPKMLSRTHVAGNVDYKVSPPVGGNHNEVWQNCEGDVYNAQIADEHAVHSLEHGAVWITYNPDLPQAQIEELAKKVRGQDYMLMSPYPGLKSPISLQAWGFELKVDSADDSRIDDFIVAFRKSASVEPGSNCASNLTTTGDQPVSGQQGGVPQVPGGAQLLPGQAPGGAQLPGGAGLPGGVQQ